MSKKASYVVTRITLQDLSPVRCGTCGRFLGLECIEKGVSLIKCKNCKNWALLVRGGSELYLTKEELYGRLSEGQKTK